MENNTQFATAYTVSNEDLRWVSGNFPDARRVLTVAASGDQALFHTLAGATHIDTFDRTPYARFIQEIKFAALQNLDREEYYNLLLNLNRASLGHVCDVPEFKKLMPHLSDKTVAEIKSHDEQMHHIFGAGYSVRTYSFNVPTDDEYAQLRAKVRKPFNFTLADIRELNTRIDTDAANYDLINTSNIIDYIPANNVGPMLINLTGLLRVGGRIIAMPQLVKYKFTAGARATDTASRTLEYADEITHPADRFKSIVIFQRTR